MYVKLLIFRIVFLLLFLLSPIFAIIKGIKNKSIDNIFFYLKHPISIFDSNLKSYNLYYQNDEIIIAQDKNYWKILFKHYNYPFLEKPVPNSDILKVLVSNDKVYTIQLGKFNIQENLTGEILENNLPTSTLNSIIKHSISIHKKVKNKFKIIELTVAVHKDDYYFISGSSNPILVKTKDINYYSKAKNIINFLYNSKK